MTIVNIVDCVPKVHHVWRKRNTIHVDKWNIMMTDDLHIPVTVCSYIAPYTAGWIASFTLQTRSIWHQLDLSGKHSAMLQFLQEGCSVTYYHHCLIIYIQHSEMRQRGKNKIAQTSKWQQRAFEPGLPRLRVWCSTTELPCTTPNLTTPLLTIQSHWQWFLRRMQTLSYIDRVNNEAVLNKTSIMKNIRKWQKPLLFVIP